MVWTRVLFLFLFIVFHDMKRVLNTSLSIFSLFFNAKFSLCLHLRWLWLGRFCRWSRQSGETLFEASKKLLCYNLADVGRYLKFTWLLLDTRYWLLSDWMESERIHNFFLKPNIGFRLIFLLACLASLQQWALKQRIIDARGWSSSPWSIVKPSLIVVETLHLLLSKLSNICYALNTAAFNILWSLGSSLHNIEETLHLIEIIVCFRGGFGNGTDWLLLLAVGLLS